MSMIRVVLALALVGGCTKVPGTSSADEPDRDRQGVIAPAPAPATAKVTLVSVRFADDCGGAPPPAPITAPANRRAFAAPPASQAPGVVAQDSIHGCEQTSMQLSIAAKSNAVVQIKTVEVFDEKGASLGMLTASTPTRWSDASSTYEAWDQNVAAGSTATVSYVLSQPSFVNRYDSHDRMYTVKVTASVGGVAQALQQTVMVVAQPAPVPT